MSCFHFFFTAPYWSLMISSVSYEQFPEYVTKMKKILEAWSGLILQLNDLVSAFDNFLSDRRGTSEFIAIPSEAD